MLLDCGLLVAAQDDGGRVVGHLALGLGVHARHVEVLEDLRSVGWQVSK